MSDDRINETGYTDTVNDITPETCATNHRTGNNGRTSVGKCKLENPVCKQRNARGFVSRRSSLKKKPVHSDKTISVAEHKGVSDGPEKQAAKAGIKNTFHQNVYRFPGTGEPGFQHHETRLHTKNQKSSYQRPDRIN
jgi:hypothetical protein